MPEVRKRVLYCAILLIVVGATSCLFGAVYFSSSKPMPYHLAFIGMSFEELIEFNPNLAALLAVMVRTVGVCEFAVGILVIGIALGAFRRAERWAWLTVFPAVSVVLADILRACFAGDVPVKWVVLALVLLFFIKAFHNSEIFLFSHARLAFGKNLLSLRRTVSEQVNYCHRHGFCWVEDSKLGILY